MFHLVELVGVGRDIPCRVAGIGFAKPPAIGGRRTKLVGAVGRAGINVVAARRIRLVVVGRAGAADVVAWHYDPLITFVGEHIDQVTRVAHFGGEKSFRMIAEVRVATPCLPPGLFENLQLLAEDRLRQQRRERVVVGETNEIHARGSCGGKPSACLAVTVVPTRAIAQLTERSELTDIVDERSRVADGESACVVETAERIARTALVGSDPILNAENFREIVFRVLFRTQAAVILTRLEHDRIPCVLHAAGL